MKFQLTDDVDEVIEGTAPLLRMQNCGTENDEQKLEQSTEEPKRYWYQSTTECIYLVEINTKMKNAGH